MRHVIRAMRRYDLTNKKTMTKTMTKTFWRNVFLYPTCVSSKLCELNPYCSFQPVFFQTVFQKCTRPGIESICSTVAGYILKTLNVQLLHCRYNQLYLGGTTRACALRPLLHDGFKAHAQSSLWDSVHLVCNYSQPTRGKGVRKANGWRR